MKKRTRLKRALLLLPLLIAAIAIIIFIPYKKALVIQYQNTGKVLAYIPFTEEEFFKIKYTHSIHLSDVVESYKPTKDLKIQQYELMYEDFAIGMPDNASEGEVFEQKDGKYYIRNMNRVFPHFDMRTGKVRANHRIIYNGIEYPMAGFIEPGTWVRFTIDKINIYQQLEGVNILEQ